jgi:hypothetical protein
MRHAIAGSLFVLQHSVALFAQQPLSPGPDSVVRSQQEQTSALASQWIRDADPKRQAWGAYLIGRDRRTELLPLLLDCVAQHRDFGPPISAQDFEQTAAMSVVLDTLIQLDARVPGRHAMDVFPRFPAQALILLSYSAVENREILLSLMDQAKSDEVWLGAGNLLSTGAAGFAARLMNEITVHAEVTVVNGERRPVAGGVGSGGSIGCGGPSRPPLDWPEAGQYALTLVPERSESLLAWGTRPVYYRRVLGRADYHPWQEPQGSSNRDPYRLEYLARFIDKTPASLPFALHPRITIVWSGAEAYRGEVEAFLQQQRILFHILASDLRMRQWMTPDEEQAVRLRIVVEVSDFRSNPSGPLPIAPIFFDPGPLAN